MNIIFSSDSLRSTVTIALPGWRSWAVLIAAAAAIAGGIYWGAQRLADEWVRTQDPRVAELIKAERARADAERREFLDDAVGRLADQATDMQIRMWRLAELGNLIAERLDLPDESLIRPDEIPLPSADAEAEDSAGAAGISSLDARLTGLDFGLARVGRLLDSYGEQAAVAAMRAATLPDLEIAPLAGPYRRSSGFGRRKDPFTGRPAFHSGYDYAARSGTPVVASADGIVTHVGRLGNYGLAVEIYHGDELSTLYAHLSKARAEEGRYVRRSDVIGYVGSTGRSSGPHLHLEIRVDKRPRSRTAFAKRYAERIAQASGEKEEGQ